MSVAWQPKRWWIFSLSEVEKKIGPILTKKFFQCTSVAYNMGVLGHFGIQRLDIVQKYL